MDGKLILDINDARIIPEKVSIERVGDVINMVMTTQGVERRIHVMLGAKEALFIAQCLQTAANDACGLPTKVVLKGFDK